MQSTPLHWAASSGYTDSVALLIANGADVNMKTMVSYCNNQSWLLLLKVHSIRLHITRYFIYCYSNVI